MCFHRHSSTLCAEYAFIIWKVTSLNWGSFLLIFQCSRVIFGCILNAGVPWCWAWKQARMGLLWWGITMWSICIWTWVIVSAIVITWEATSPKGNCPHKGWTVGVPGTAGPVPLPAKPQLQLSKWFLQQDAGDATDVTRGCILKPRREHSFHTPNLFFPPSNTFFYRVSI